MMCEFRGMQCTGNTGGYNRATGQGRGAQQPHSYLMAEVASIRNKESCLYPDSKGQRVGTCNCPTPWYRPPSWGTLEESFNLLVSESPISQITFGDLAVSSGGGVLCVAAGRASGQCRGLLSLSLMISISTYSAIKQIRL